MEVLLGEMQISGCHLQVFMTEQTLDSAQAGPAFQRSVAQLWRSNEGETFLRIPAVLPSFGADMPHDLVCNRLFAVAMLA